MKNTKAYEHLWRMYVAPKGRVGNALQGAALKSLETARLAPRLSRANTIILTHSQGKVGSSSMYEALTSNPLPDGAMAFHTHIIRSPHNAREIEDRKKITPRRTAYTTDILHPLIQRRANGNKQFIVISAVRDPIDRMISDYFQNLERYTPNRQYPKPGQHSVDEYLDWFYDGFDLERSSDWFDEQLADLFGLNLYEKPFDNNLGYQLYESPNVNAGVIRFDRISDAWTDYCTQLLGYSVELSRTNEATTKAYGHVYPDFKAQFRLPRATLDRIYDRRYVRHFYTDEERQSAILKWQKED